MHGDDRRAQRRRRSDGVLGGVRDVVNLQVQEDALAAVDDLAYDRRTIADESLQPDLEDAGDAVQLVDDGKDLVARREVERDDEPVTSLHPSSLY